ncbi:hypothetical protein [Flavobacterium davisii]|uniref:hypothetical protein n=1 Tax=Flavobacterium davisii TaxID=2906077 RepID=UPI0035CF02D2
MLSKKKTAIPQLGLHLSHNNVPIHKVYRLGIENNKLSEGYKDSFSLFSTINIKLLLNHLKTDFLKINAFNAKTYIVNNFEKFENEEFIENVSIKKDNIQTKQIKIIPQKEKDFNQLQQQIENDTYSILAKSISLNETIAYIDNDLRKNGYRVHIDINSKTINYIYSIYYKDTSGVIVRSNNKIKTSDDYRAIIVKTAGVETLFFFLEEVYGTDHANAVRLGIFERIKLELEKANNVKTLAFLYKNLPNYIKLGYNDESEIQTRPYKLPDDLLWKHLNMFANFDKGSKDASYYVVNTMSLITPKFCINEFLKDQSLVTKIYNGLDDQNAIEALFGVYEFSKTFEGGTNTFEPTNKDFFVSLLHSYAQFLEMDSQVTSFEPTGVHFHQGNKKGGKYDAEIKFTLNSNILFSDKYKNKVFIKNYWEGKKYLGQGYDQQGNVHDLYEYGRGVNEYGYYNPLDLVKFTQYNDKGEAITMNTYAIFVKYASDVKEWKKVNEGVRLGFNVIMIIAGAATITSGAGSLLLYAAIADMGLASVDIIIQGDKDKEYFRTKEGKEFLESWEKIYTVGSVATLSPIAVKFVATYAPKLVSSGAKLLQVPGTIIKNLEVLKRVEKLTTKAIYSLEIPNFNKRGLEILKVGFTDFAELKNAEKLQKLGVIFVKGVEDTVAAIYKGVTIAGGREKEVAIQLNKALNKLKGKELEKYLDELVELAGMAENVGTTKNVDAFLASAERLSRLTITAENAMDYLDEVLIHLNHYVKDGKVIKVGDNNCVEVVQVVDHYLKTGQIVLAKYSEYQDIAVLEKIYDQTFLTYKLPNLKNVMKEGEIGIIFGDRGIGKKGHVFNVIKKGEVLLYKDGQIGRDAILPHNFYKEFKYLKTK